MWGGDLSAIRRWPAWGLPRLILAYVVALVGTAVVAGLLLSLNTRWRAWDAAAFALLVTCGCVSVELNRRLGEPALVAKDLLAAWLLPIALLLPPIYSLLAPIPLGVITQIRVQRSPLHRRVFTAAAIGLVGVLEWTMFHRLAPVGQPPIGWAEQPLLIVATAVCVGVMGSLLNTFLVSIAVRGSSQEGSWREILTELLGDRENLILDLVDVCTGVLIAIGCALSIVVALVGLPPVLLLQRAVLYAQLRAAARTDAKTGLLNAKAWQREAERAISLTSRTHEPLAVLLVDLDHFKRINDTCGHLAGDQVLTATATALQETVRGYDVVGRFGGEEFVLLLPRADLGETRRVAERLRHRVAELSVETSGGDHIPVTASIGGALLGRDGTDLTELLAAADLALYRAKNAGRDRAFVSSDGLAR